VPEGKNLDSIGGHPIVEMVANAAEVNAPHPRQACIARTRTEIGLSREKGEGALKLFSDCAGRGGAVLRPPDGGFLYLSGGTPGIRIADACLKVSGAGRREADLDETNSPRSASAIAATSSSSCSGETSNASTSS
jgi:hypothetical protein